MSKIFAIITDLKMCYETKSPFSEDYLKLSNSEKERLCQPVRQSLINYVNSKEYSFLDIVHNLNDHRLSEVIIRQAIQENQKLRVLIENLRGNKKSLFDIWDRLEGVYGFKINNYEDLDQQLAQMYYVRNGVKLKDVVMFSRFSLNDSKTELEADFKSLKRNIQIINSLTFLRNKKLIPQNNKIVLVNFVPDQTKEVYNLVPFKMSLMSSLENMVKESGFNYLIIRSQLTPGNESQGDPKEQTTLSITKLLHIINDYLKSDGDSYNGMLTLNRNNKRSILYTLPWHFSFIREYNLIKDKTKLKLDRYVDQEQTISSYRQFSMTNNLLTLKSEKKIMACKFLISSGIVLRIASFVLYKKLGF